MKTLVNSIVFVATAFLFAGCGNPGQAFVGLYSVSGTETMTISTPQGARTLHDQLSGNVNFYEGSASDLVLSSASNTSCAIAFNADDFDSATLVPGTTCTETDGVYTVTAVYNSGTAIRNNKVVSYSANGTVTITGDGSTVNGTFTTTATLTKLSK